MTSEDVERFFTNAIQNIQAMMVQFPQFFSRESLMEEIMNNLHVVATTKAK